MQDGWKDGDAGASPFLNIRLCFLGTTYVVKYPKSANCLPLKVEAPALLTILQSNRFSLGKPYIFVRVHTIEFSCPS